MKIERRDRSFHVDDEGVQIVLTPEEGDKPSAIGLFIWELRPEPEKEGIIESAIEQITGHAVKEISWWAGNGHGEIKVTYKDG